MSNDLKSTNFSHTQIIKALGGSEEHRLSLLQAGEFLGEMSLFFHDRQRSASVRAVSEVELLAIPYPEFETFLNRHPTLMFDLLRDLSLRVRNSDNATIRELKGKNRQLEQAYQELKAAQAMMIAQEKIKHELAMARKIQEDLLPKAPPELLGWRISAYWQPARAVSGDFYDFIPFPDGKLAMIIGDVTDKGVPAALVMATTRNTLRSLSSAVDVSKNGSPGYLLCQANDLLTQDMPLNMFVTCLVIFLDPTNGSLTFANAGHNLPVHHSAQSLCELRARGMPLGIMADMIYDENQACMATGDRLVLYSDGLVEAHNPQGEMFGTERMLQVLAQTEHSFHSDGEALKSALIAELAQFTGPGWEQEDDITLVILERTQ